MCVLVCGCVCVCVYNIYTCDVYIYVAYTQTHIYPNTLALLLSRRLVELSNAKDDATNQAQIADLVRQEKAGIRQVIHKNKNKKLKIKNKK
jgi:hypothetical protein